jgi:hypothetical protein
MFAQNSSIDASPIHRRLLGWVVQDEGLNESQVKPSHIGYCEERERKGAGHSEGNVSDGEA